MKKNNAEGFTIIEVMLFLAVSGLLVAGLVAGTAGVVDAQRYRDSVTSFRNNIQSYYSNVLSTTNNRPSNVQCNSDAVISVGGGISNYRGQSDCVILGKYIVSNGTGDKLTSKTVVGALSTTLADLDNTTNDIDALELYEIRVDDDSEETYSPEWDTIFNTPESSGIVSSKFSILILRSPSSGTIRTFIDENNIITDNNIKNLINDDRLKTDLTICLKSNNLTISEKMAVFIGANSANVGGVKTLSEGEGNGC